MRKLNVVLSLICSLLSSIVWAEAPDPAVAFIKADFQTEIPVSGFRKLIGGGENALFWAKQDGSVEVADEAGKPVATLPAKVGKEELLKQPEAVAVEAGVAYVVDAGTEQVVMYAVPEGRYLGRFGGKEGGFFGSKDESALDAPRGVAVHEGVVYVADTEHARIQMFGVNGVFLQTLAVFDPEAKAGEEGPGKLKKPVSIAVDERGTIYVLDEGDKQVKIYGSNGKYAQSLKGVTNPGAMALAEDGIYVSDANSQVISKFAYDGTLAYTFGSQGEGKAQFKKTAGLAAGKGQKVYVGDVGKSLVDLFLTQAGERLESIPRLNGRVSVKWLGSMDFEASALAGGGTGELYALARDGKSLAKAEGDKFASPLKFDDMELSAITLDAAGALWALDRKGKRGVKLDAAGKVLTSFGSSGNGAGQFSNPSAIAVTTSGLVFVADRGNRNIQVFRQDGVYLSSLASPVAPVSNPVALGVDPTGNVYALDAGRGSVLVFKANGDFAQEFGKGQLDKPQDMVLTQDTLYVLDGSQVKAYSFKGELLHVFGSRQTGAGSLPEPAAIAAAGASTLYVADRSHKSVQRYAVLYKPQAPEQFMAKGQVHAIELTWAKAQAPFVKEYRIYRSQTEERGYVQIATTTRNAYTDGGLEAGAKFYYRISAFSDQGYEGLTSAAATEVAQKFTPSALTEIKVETTPWQVKITWPAAAPQYFAAYRIYQKEGENFNKIGEVTQPQFVKDALQPETKYTYAVSVLSTDGTESEKLPVEATTQVFNRPPLDIEVLKLSDVFSNSYKMYEADGVGRIKLTNYTDKPMERLRVSFQLKNFMDFPTETKIDLLQPGQSQEVALKAVFNNSILSLTEDTPVQVLIEASYFEKGKRVTYSRNETINIYDKHRLSWDQRERFAAFVTPKDPPVLNLARTVVSEFKETKDEVQLAAAFFDALGVFGLTYIQDPTNPYQVSSGKVNAVDYIQFPRETLERKSGDCDDLVAVYSAGLESMGIATRVLEVPGHMLMMFSTGLPADGDGYTHDNLYVIYEGMLWVPVETTLVGNSFIKAWENGSSTYYKFKDNGLTILDVHHAWETFKPASLPDSDWRASGTTRAAIEKKFPGDHASVLKISSRVRTRRYLEAIRNNPSDVEAHLQMGIVLAKLGDHGEAMKYFEKVLSLDPKNASAMNNKGNILMIQDKYAEAQKAYVAATKLMPNDAQVWVNLTRAYMRTSSIKNAKAAFARAQKLDPAIKDQYRALALELNNAL